MDGEVGQPEEVGPDDHGPERVPRERVGVEAATTDFLLTLRSKQLLIYTSTLFKKLKYDVNLNLLLQMFIKEYRKHC